jgi:hypothetical protein
VFSGWEKSLKKLGHQVMVYNTNERLTFYGRSYLEDVSNYKGQSNTQPGCITCGQPPYKKAMDDEQVKQMALKGILETSMVFWPEVVFFVSAFFFTAPLFQVLKARNMKLVMLHTESPYEDEKQMARGEFADLNLLNDPVNLQAWKDLGPAAAYMPHSYDPDIHYPPNPRNYEADFSFVGTGFKSRRDFFGKLNLEGIDTAIGGGGWGDALNEPENAHVLKYLGHHPEQCVDNEETARIYRLTKVGINKYREESEDEHAGEGWAMGPREVEMAASELFFLRDSRPEGDEIFEGILPVYRSADEASDLLRYWVRHDTKREDRARRARAAIADRTFDNHAAYFMRLAEEAGIC